MQEQILYLYTILENRNLKKIITNSILFIHYFLQTMINKTIHILTFNQYTINNLTTLIKTTCVSEKKLQKISISSLTFL
jgi:hypothetical protein